MKKHLKRIVAAFLSVIMCLGLCACSTDINTMLLLKKVGDSIEKVNSFEGDINCKAKAKYGSFPLNLSIDADVDYIVDPMKLELDAEIDLGLLGEIEFEVYAIADGQKADIYFGIEKPGTDDVMSWTHSTVEIPTGESVNLRDPAKLLDSGAGISAKSETKMIGTVQAVKIVLTLPMDMLKDAIKCDENINDIEVNIWVAKKDGRVLRIESDLTQAAQVIANSVAGGTEEIVINSLPIVMDIESVNSVTDIKVPRDAMNAA